MKRICMEQIVTVIGAGSIGQAIARRISAGKLLLLADLRLQQAEAAAELLRDAGFELKCKPPRWISPAGNRSNSWPGRRDRREK